MKEARSFFGEDASKLAKMLQGNEVGTKVLLDILSDRISNHEKQYHKVCDGLVMEGDNRAVLVRAAHIRGELADTQLIYNELKGLVENGS